MNLIELAETGLIPDKLVRMGIRHLLAKRIEANRSAHKRQSLASFVERLRQSPLAIATDTANEQHYEVPVEFFQHVLGPHLKYSACWFEQADASLAEAELAMLRITCERANLQDRMSILELGCGWGSLSLFMAEQFPASSITAVSNSSTQREFIEQSASERNLTNLQVITADMRDFDTEEKYDRIVSIEMFEHMRNYQLLFEKLSTWLQTDGKAFVHIFCHRDMPYLFETEGSANWMGHHFFAGGTMPSENLFSQFNADLSIEQQWHINGLHYWRTCEAWLNNLDRNREAILARFGQDLSSQEAKLKLQRWRMFFMACAELFRYRDGEEWLVAHYRLRSSPRYSSSINSGSTGASSSA